MAHETARTLAIVVVAAALTALGALGASGRRHESPSACARPALEGTLLRCDGVGAPPGAAAWLVGARLDLNAARRDDLMALPRVGPKMAERILAARDARGGFRTVDELLQVKGIGPKTLARLRPLVDVSPAAVLDLRPPEAEQGPQRARAVRGDDDSGVGVPDAFDDPDKAAH